MLAFEPSRQQQTPYFQHFTMDPALTEPFTFHVDLSGFGQAPNSSRLPQSSHYDTPSIDAYSDTNKVTSFPPMPATPPSIPISHSEPYMPSLSTASGPSIASASSSAIGSPYSGTAPAIHENWVDTNHGLGLPAAVMSDLFPNEYIGNSLDMEGFYSKKNSDNYVDPSLIETLQPQTNIPQSSMPYPEQPNYGYPGFHPQSPELPYLPQAEECHTKQAIAQQLNHIPTSSPLINDRRSSISSELSRRSQLSPAASNADLDDETKEKGRCPHPDCGRVFKDLKAHLLTHRSERPEKCPIVNCEYHIKGFARKYDKNRHTLIHYKGTMVCGFCPGSGSPAEKSFNRADVFKRHLTSVHGVEQTPPNCRKKSPAASNKAITGYRHDATVKCSTCPDTFDNAQEFYEHLDDCVLRVVQKEQPSEAVNQRCLAEVDSDEEVKKTMEKHKLLDTAGTVYRYDDEFDDDEDDSNEVLSLRRSANSAMKASRGSASTSARVTLGNSAVTKRPISSKRRNNRDRYPQSWGCPRSNINIRKRVLCVFDGQRRLLKDEMMLKNEHEVRVKLPGGTGDGTNREAYVTDLDVQTLKRAEGILSATAEERGPWLDGPSSQMIGPPAMPMASLSHPYEGEVDFGELMA
ncbi:C2H2 finger domain protein [Aspergillus bombycis]|uniref:C2H2 finger domain protein n=1 Tax=Aspergillus bombycis TaxID=109264 RepID=A0A1F7ZN80_9EURO|nr:C2H2 finger domain protein [Aspergillus bombycis]OGM40903.1 C2H2 finger domain protein [Aspergillus bombycis]